jgi:hypothetical protein
VLQSNSCICPSKYFKNSENECLPCDSSCEECQTQANQCTSCPANYEQINGVCKKQCDANCSVCGENGVCSTCNNAYFSNGVLGICTPCDSTKCVNCIQSSTQCTSCPTGYDLDPVSSICLARCSPGQFRNANNQCEACSSPCLECSESSTFCTSCD